MGIDKDEVLQALKVARSARAIPKFSELLGDKTRLGDGRTCDLAADVKGLEQLHGSPYGADAIRSAIVEQLTHSTLPSQSAATRSKTNSKALIPVKRPLE